jgi:hypothetical protein
MESIMNHPSLCDLSFSSAACGRRTATMAMAALVLAACAFLPAAPAAAADSGHAVYCLSGDSENDCGFTSLAQCEATTSGGLGECEMVPAVLPQRGPAALRRFQAKPRKVRG